MSVTPTILAVSAPGYDWTGLRLIFGANSFHEAQHAPRSIELTRDEAALLIRGGFAKSTDGAKQEVYKQVAA